jgi:hypothetical protein
MARSPGRHTPKAAKVSARRALLVLLSSLSVGAPLWAQPLGPLDSVAVYLVPLDDFPEGLAEALAKSLQQETGIRIKASLRLPPLRINTLPGTNQLIAEDALAQGAQASARLPEVVPTTWRVLLTTKDINASSGNFRFQFSMHSKALNCSIVSLARLLDYVGDKPTLSQQSLVRLTKLIKRAIGEFCLGWTRSADPKDIMYAPLMSLDDLDRMGNDHAAEQDGAKPKRVVPDPPPASDLRA